MYRFDSIKSGAPVGILETPTFHPDYLASEQEDQSAIENALASTHASMRPNQNDKNAFVEEVKAALENVHKRGAGASASARAIAKEFLEGLIQELKRSK
jgi:hypothetical protein